MQNFMLDVGNEKLCVTVEKPSGSSIAHVVSIHGAGRGNRRRVDYLVDPVVNQMACTFVRFDHSGHGDSSGSLDGCTLEKRLDEVRAVIDKTWDQETPLVLIGTSMGGFEAAMITRDYPTAGLVLFCPAAYDAQAITATFPDAFRALIHVPGSYQTSPSFDVLSAYSGRALLVVAGDDQTVPAVITDCYADCLTNNKNFQRLDFAACPHSIHEWVIKNPEQHKQLIAALSRVVCGDNVKHKRIV